ncbi:MAG: HRDC domain-containing protein, partial [Methanobacteriaceae archaeon]|nr:HRDC domain-containing protein [Methanobacteriaceae archaeon]
KALLITDKGMEFSSSPRYLNNILFNNQSRKISPEDKILFNELRDLRKDISINRNVPAYIICGNDVLLNMAREKPLNKDSLLSIKGVGEKFLENYGEAFLDLIEEYNIGNGEMVGMDY